MIGVGSMWVLHIPFIFIALHHSYFLMTLQMIVLLISGTIFIWPIYSPVQENRINPLQRVIYLFTACVGCSVLGILITFTPVNLYDSCMIGFNEDILSVIRFNWGITPPIDQQFGGLIMWLPACMIYLTNVLITIFQWYESDEVEKIENNVKVSNKQF
jgi:putative membrane protein